MSIAWSTLLLALVPVAWLVPNHYYPWLSAWQDGMAIAFLVAGALVCRRPMRLPGHWATALTVALLSVAWQYATGRITYGGDALMAALYLLTFALSLALGAAHSQPASAPSTDSFLAAMALGVLAAAVLSTAIALVQWTSVGSLGIWGADLKPRSRPYANVAQPNNFCTIAFLGLCAAALLREQRRIGTPGLVVVAIWLLCGMVMSGSRTGWLQIVLLMGCSWAYAKRARLVVQPRLVFGLAGLFVCLTLLWPWLSEWTGFGGARSAQEQLRPGTRLAQWQAMIDAIGRRPWSGWGWQQIGAAQQVVAVDHLPVGEQIEHSHNIVLDLFLWAGVPVGGLFLLLVIAALWRTYAAARDPRAVWLLAGAGGLLVHANLELPLEYAYFLIPMGLALGSALALGRADPGAETPPITRPAAFQVAGVVLAAVLATVAIDYLEAEENSRTLRLEAARVGVSRLQTPAPELRVLDHLQAFLEFARTEARPGMTQTELERMHRVALRFGYPPVMLRYALAAALNGRPEQAARTLDSLCRIHPRERCDEGRDAWSTLQQRYPQLRPIAWPSAAFHGVGGRAAADRQQTATPTAGH